MKMKNFGKVVLALTIFLMTITFIFPQNVLADTIIPGYRGVQECTKISGINNSLDYYVVGYIDPVMKNEPNINPYIVKENECLNKGYKFNKFKLYAVSKTYLDQKGLQNIDFSNDNNLIPSNVDDLFFTKSVKDSDPLIKEEHIYTILGFNPSNYTLFLQKSQYLAEYNDGTPPKTENYYLPENPVSSMGLLLKISDVPPAPNPSPTTTSNSTSTPTSTTTISKTPTVPFLSNTGNSAMVLVIAGVLVIICVGLYFVLKKKNK